MEGQKSPFINVTATCPICAHQFPAYKLKSGLYSVMDKESDQHPLVYKWADKEFSAIMPHYYSFWRCPQCFYIDFIDTFEKPGSDHKLSAGRKIYKAFDINRHPFVLEILKYTDPSNISFETTVNQFLHSAYIQELGTRHEDKNFFKLAKLYLRIAWLYREKYGVKKNEDQPEKIGQIIKTMLKIEDEYSKIEELSTKLVTLIKARVGEIYGALPEVPISNPYYQSIGPYLTTLKSLSSTLGKVKSTASLDEQGRINVEVNNVPNGYFDFPAYIDFLAHLSSFWREVPLNEKDALRLAVKNYSLSYTHEDIFDTPEKRLQAVDLISDIFVRLEDYASAINYVNEIYRGGNKERQALYQKLNTRKPDGTALSQLEKDRIEAQISRINSSLNKASTKRKELEEKCIEVCLPKINELLESNPDITESEFIAKLAEINVPVNVYNSLKEKGMIKQLVSQAETETPAETQQPSDCQ